MALREISLDTETTGLDPDSGHRIVEIGCVEMINHIATQNHFHVYLNPERDMPQEAEKIHGLSMEFLKDKPLFRSVADAFLEFLQDSTLVIHNAQFDMKFINAELGRLGYPVIPMKRALDTVQMARRKFPGQPANLDALCRQFNVDASARVKHGALLDAELLADVYLELRGGRQTGLGLEQKTEKKITAELPSHQEQTIPARSFPPTEDEIKLHTQMLSELTEPLWEKTA